MANLHSRAFPKHFSAFVLALSLMFLPTELIGQVAQASPLTPPEIADVSSISKTDTTNYELPAKFKGVHPRLFADENRLDEIKKLIQTSAKYQEMWQRFKAKADRVKAPGKDFDLQKALKGDFRGLEDQLFTLVAAYRLSDDKAYFEKAKLWANVWSGFPDKSCEDFGSAELMYAMALYYDWCWQDLSPDERDATNKLLIKWGSLTKTFLETSHIRYLLSNQWQVRISGIGVCGLAADDDSGQAAALTNFAVHEYQVMEDAKADDGVTIEGVGYGRYGIYFETRFDDLTQELLGVNFYANKWWYNDGLYQVYLSTPRNSWHSKMRYPGNSSTGWINVDIGDCPRYNWYGPDDLLRDIAKETNNGYAQWLADAVDQDRLECGNSFLNLFRYDESVQPQSPESLPTLHHFENTGLISARSDWSGNESLVTFICGPYFGHQAEDHYNFDLGGGHSHPNANAFGIFGAGEWLVSWPGYVQRRANYENTLIVSGKGQLGQDVNAGGWDAMPLINQKLHPRITKAVSNPEFDLMTGDATPSYFGLNKYVRHLLYIKPNTLLVLDDIASDHDEDYQLYFHCEAPPDKGQAQPDGSYLVQGDKALLSVHPLTLDGVQATGAGFTFNARHSEREPNGVKFCVTLEKKASTWRNATAFTWSDGTNNPDSVSLQQKGDVWAFTLGGKTYDYDWNADSLVKE